MTTESAGIDRLTLPPPPSQSLQNDCRLWIGNLDPKITEYAMLKLLQKFKNVSLQQFDFIYHRSGPEKGRPRGYCFVTLGSPLEAATVLHGLNGKLALSRRLVVKYAEVEKRDASLSCGSTPSTSAVTETKKLDVCVEGKIQAIEAKLQMMEENKDGGTPPVILYPPPANLKRQQELATEAAESSKRRNRSEYQYRRPRQHRPYKSRRGR